MCLSGYVLARRGVLDKSTQRVSHIFYLPSYPSHSIISQQLNSLNVNFFTPCLLFSKVAFFLSPGPPSIIIRLADSLRLIPEKLRELWIIPIFFLLVTGTSLGVAWLLGNLFRLKPSQRYPDLLSGRPKSHLVSTRNFAMAAATFMNSNSLPVALLQSLAATVPDLKWGKDDTKDAIIGRALTYLLLCSTIGQFVSKFYFGLLSCDLIQRVVDSLELWRSPAFHGRSNGGSNIRRNWCRATTALLPCNIQ